MIAVEPPAPRRHRYLNWRREPRAFCEAVACRFSLGDIRALDRHLPHIDPVFHRDHGGAAACRRWQTRLLIWLNNLREGAAPPIRDDRTRRVLSQIVMGVSPAQLHWRRRMAGYLAMVLAHLVILALLLLPVFYPLLPFWSL